LRIVLHREIIRFRPRAVPSALFPRRRHEERFINVSIRDVRTRIDALFAAEARRELAPSLERTTFKSRVNHAARNANKRARARGRAPIFAPLIVFIVLNVARVTKARTEQSGMQSKVCIGIIPSNGLFIAKIAAVAISIQMRCACKNISRLICCRTVTLTYRRLEA